MTQFISYIRVSDVKQEKSGLGLEAQRKAVYDYLVTHGGELIEEVVEIASGKRDNRAQLKRALDLCRKHQAVLLLPKLDRLSRRVAFISNLMDSKIQFKVADMPDATNFMLHIYAAVAEEERRMIAERTKRALSAAKARGTVLGKNGQALAAHNKEAASAYSEGLRPQITTIRQAGATTLAQITNALNSAKIPTFRGGDTRWHIPQTRKLLMRLDAQAA
jgi:DNA invertase Pin-like site-specific DNA recombinase